METQLRGTRGGEDEPRQQLGGRDLSQGGRARRSVSLLMLHSGVPRPGQRWIREAADAERFVAERRGLCHGRRYFLYRLFLFGSAYQRASEEIRRRNVACEDL